MSSTQHHLEPPSNDVEPLKANIYTIAKESNTTLALMFPYLHGGSIVAAVSLVAGDRSLDPENASIVEGSSFFHRNSEEEVICIWGSSSPDRPPGFIAVLGKQHHVKWMVPEFWDEQQFNLATIVQRQVAAGEQHESMTIRCPSCNIKLLQHAYDGSVEGSADVVVQPHAGTAPIFPTVYQHMVGAERYNAELAGTPCPGCDHDLPEFTIDLWGWREASRRHDVSVAAQQSRAEAFAAAADPAGAS